MQDSENVFENLAIPSGDQTYLSHSVGDLSLDKSRVVGADGSDHVDSGTSRDSWDSHGILQIFDGYNLSSSATTLSVYLHYYPWLTVKSVGLEYVRFRLKRKARRVEKIRGD